MNRDRTRQPASKARTTTRRMERHRKAVAAWLVLAMAPDASPFAPLAR